MTATPFLVRVDAHNTIKTCSNSARFIDVLVVDPTTQQTARLIIFEQSKPLLFAGILEEIQDGKYITIDDKLELSEFCLMGKIVTNSFLYEEEIY